MVLGAHLKEDGLTRRWMHQMLSLTAQDPWSWKMALPQSDPALGPPDQLVLQFYRGSESPKELRYHVDCSPSCQRSWSLVPRTFWKLPKCFWRCCMSLMQEAPHLPWDVPGEFTVDPFSKESPSPQICLISLFLHPDLGALNSTALHPLPFNSNRFPLVALFCRRMSTPM